MTDTGTSEQEISSHTIEPTVFRSVIRCLDNSNKIKEKIIQFNKNVSSVIRDGCIEIDQICNKVRERLKEVEARIDEEGDEGFETLVQDTVQECSDENATQDTREPSNESEREDSEVYTITEQLQKQERDADKNMVYLFMRNILNDSLDKVLYFKEHEEKKSERPRRKKRKTSDGRSSDLEDPIKETDPILEILRSEMDISRRIDEIFRALSLSSISTCSLDKYEKRCEYLQDQLKMPESKHESNDKPVIEIPDEDITNVKVLLEKILYYTDRKGEKEDVDTMRATLPLEEVIKHLAEKIRIEKSISKDGDDNLKYVLLNSNSTDSIDKYKKRCEYMQEKLRIITQDLCETFSKGPSVDIPMDPGNIKEEINIVESQEEIMSITEKGEQKTHDEGISPVVETKDLPGDIEKSGYHKDTSEVGDNNLKGSSTNYLERYKKRSELLQQKLRIITQNVYRTLSDKPVTDMSRKSSEENSVTSDKGRKRKREIAKEKSRSEGDVPSNVSKNLIYLLVQNMLNDSLDKILIFAEKEKEEKEGITPDTETKLLPKDTPLEEDLAPKENQIDLVAKVRSEVDTVINEVAIVKSEVSTAQGKNEEIFKEVDESLKVISLINMSTNSLQNYKKRCELLHEKLRELEQDMTQNISFVKEKEAAGSNEKVKNEPEEETKSKEDTSKCTKDVPIPEDKSKDLLTEAVNPEKTEAVIKDEANESRILVEKAVDEKAQNNEISLAVDESLKAIYQIYMITNSLLKNLNVKCLQLDKCPENNKDMFQSTGDALPDQEDNHQVVNKPVKSTPAMEVLKSPNQDTLVSNTVIPLTTYCETKYPKNAKVYSQKKIMENTIESIKNKLRQQKDVKGTYFEDIKETIKALSNNFEVMNKLVESVNKDILNFSENAEIIESELNKEDPPKTRFHTILPPKINSRQWSARMGNSLDLHSTNTRRLVTKPNISSASSNSYRKASAPGLKKRSSAQITEPESMKLYKKLYAEFGPKANFFTAR